MCQISHRKTLNKQCLLPDPDKPELKSYRAKMQSFVKINYWLSCAGVAALHAINLQELFITKSNDLN
jgi:hypothetical protein